MSSAEDPLADVPTDALDVAPIRGPIDADITPPGSKSITNRALICAALASGTSELTGVLFADDTEAMLGCLGELGVGLDVDPSACTVVIHGLAGVPSVGGALLDARMSGTTSRFIAPVAALGNSTVVLDGAESLRARPMGDLLDTLVELGAVIKPLGVSGHLPVRIEGRGLSGGTVEMAGDVSSQFLSGVLLAAPEMDAPLTVEMAGDLVSKPYVAMTLDVMASFGAVVGNASYRSMSVQPSGYSAVERYPVEVDASAASYFFAAAALCGGKVRVHGLRRDSLQGDVGFVGLLEQMGLVVRRGPDHIEVEKVGPIRGLEVDMSSMSDVAQTLAMVATVASTPTTVTGIGFIRNKETDRLAAVVSELQRLGIDATEHLDGFTVVPGPTTGGTVETYDDHRMAMSFALLGLVNDGIRISDPHCVAKTYPGFWKALSSLGEIPAQA